LRRAEKRRAERAQNREQGRAEEEELIQYAIDGNVTHGYVWICVGSHTEWTTAHRWPMVFAHVILLPHVHPAHGVGWGGLRQVHCSITRS